MKKSIIFCMFCLSSSLMAMQPAQSGWNDSYEQRCVSATCFCASCVCTGLAGRQELGHDFHWGPVSIHGQEVPSLCPIVLSPLCAFVGATQLDYTPNHSCCCVCLRRALGRRAVMQVPSAQKME